MARQVLENGVILPAEYSDDWYDDMTSNLTKLDDVIGSDSEKLSSADVGAAALSNNYNDLDNLPTIPTVNDATLTIQKNGVDVQTFTANASSNVTANITVPTKTSDLTNDSNFVDTSNSAVASGITSAKVTDYDTHIADTDKHVTTADKNRWNNQTYVLRYSSTTLVASSTNSNALLDNTDNLKVGDKVIDSSGVIYSVTAIDTANSTFTIGTSLIDLAQDSDVVHKSGNETKSGELTLNDTLNTSNIIPKSNNTYECGSSSIIWKNLYSYHGYFCGQQQGDEYSSNTRTNLTLLSNRDKLDESGILFDTYRQNTAQGTGIHILGISIKENSVRYEGCRFGWYWDNILNGYYLDFKPTTQGIYQAVKHNLGTSIDKWDTINGVEPSSLSLPDLDNGIDISSYITTGDTDNNYTPPANGWIWIRLIGNGASIIQGDFGINSSYVTNNLTNEKWVETNLFVTKDVQAIIRCRGITGIVSAKFYPCQGNV